MHTTGESPLMHGQQSAGAYSEENTGQKKMGKDIEIHKPRDYKLLTK